MGSRRNSCCGANLKKNKKVDKWGNGEERKNKNKARFDCKRSTE
jgi:hypothetical protein